MPYIIYVYLISNNKQRPFVHWTLIVVAVIGIEDNGVNDASNILKQQRIIIK